MAAAAAGPVLGRPATAAGAAAPTGCCQRLATPAAAPFQKNRNTKPLHDHTQLLHNAILCPPAADCHELRISQSGRSSGHARSNLTVRNTYTRLFVHWFTRAHAQKVIFSDDAADKAIRETLPVHCYLK